jgi:tetratricopeptide (TPR) repeat protein
MGQRGLAAAWRAQLRMIQGVEYLEQDQQRLDEEARDYSRIALEREPQNSAVLAVVANARLFYETDVSGCQELAKRSVRINPSSPLAWDSLSNAMLYTGDYQEAHRLSRYAQRIAAGSPQGFWWDLGRCLTATLTGKLDEALTYAQISHAMAPTCRATLRYLIGLYCAHNRFEQAIECANRLKALEPEFSFDVLASNPDYPARLLQRAGLVDAKRVAGLDR